jgi:dihydrofolate reductase
MKELVLYIAQSLDGYIARSNESIDWLLLFDDESTSDRYNKFIETVDTIVMGYTTYRQVIEELAVNNWPYYDKKVYVITHRKLANPYNVQFYQGDIEELIQTLKSETQKNIWLVGGSKIIDQCMQSKLIDRYFITIIPTILSEGIPLFAKTLKSTPLKQINTFQLKNCVECEYINV